MPDLSHLSKRGNIAYNTVLKPDYELHSEASKNVYDAVNNPQGTFLLNVADNKLNWSKLKEKIQLISATKEIPDWVSGYSSGRG